MIDFEHARSDLWLADVHTLVDGPWRSRPALAEAFWDGYGRAPDENEAAILTAVRALYALGTVAWQARTRTPRSRPPDGGCCGVWVPRVCNARASRRHVLRRAASCSSPKALRASGPASARSMTAVDTTSTVPLLNRIAAGQRASLALGRELRTCDGFVVAMAAGAADGLSIAVPSAVAPVTWEPGLSAVHDTFSQRGTAARIEYVDELQPALAPAAHAAGWRTASLAPLMTLAAPALVAQPPAGARVMRFVQADDTVTLEAFLRGQHRAFGGDGEDDALAWLPIVRLGLREGAMDVVALERRGRVVAGASLVRGAGVSELAGVWTLPQVRRQGLARAACSALLAHGFAAGDSLAWLSTEAEAAGLYRSLGFRTVGHQRTLEHAR